MNKLGVDWNIMSVNVNACVAFPFLGPLVLINLYTCIIWLEMCFLKVKTDPCIVSKDTFLKSS